MIDGNLIELMRVASESLEGGGCMCFFFFSNQGFRDIFGKIE